MTCLEFTIPMVLPSVANLREFWAVKATRNKKHRIAVTSYWRNAVTAEQAKGFKPPYLVTLTRQAPRRLDGDNLQSAFKACRDAVAAMLDVDDADERITFLYAQAKGPAAVRVKVQGA